MKTKKVILPPILENNLAALHDICRKYHVKYLWAFGSVLTDEFRDDSDIDFLYEWDRPAIKEGQYLPNLDGLIAGLLDMFSGREIDLVNYSGMRNPYFIEEIEETKVLLYDQNREEIFT